MSHTHDLKTWSEHFQAVACGEKRFELRRDDRGFEVGDILKLNEYCPTTKIYSGNRITARITHILRNFEGLEHGFCILGIKIIIV
jgi:hypothetical protein